MHFSYDNLISKRINKSLISVGSFWSEQIETRNIALTLVGLCYRNRLFEQFDTIFRKLSNNTDLTVTNIYHKFDPEDIVFTGNDQFDTFDSQVFDDATAPDRFDQGDRYQWLIQLQKLDVDSGLNTNNLQVVIPLRIKDSKGRELILNSDFQIINDHIGFNLDPTTIFEENKFLITHGVRKSQNIYSFPTGCETDRSVNHVQRFCKINQSPENFKLALAEVSGLQAIKETQRLLYIDKNKDSTTYTFEKETITVKYKHKYLEVNKLYKKNTIIGGGIRIYTPEEGNWWKSIDFRGGFSLAPILKKPGMLVPEGTVLAYVADSEEDSYNGNKLHVRLDFLGDPEVIDAYWDEVQARELKSGKYLNDIIGIGRNDPEFIDSKFVGIFKRLKDKVEETNKKNSELGISNKEYRNIKNLRNAEIIDPATPNSTHKPGLKPVNGIDVLFEAILGKTCLFIEIEYAQVEKHFRETVRFINREQPAGVTLILVIRHPDIVQNENLNDLINDSVTHQEISQSTQSTNANLNSIIVDSFVTRIDT